MYKKPNSKPKLTLLQVLLAQDLNEKLEAMAAKTRRNKSDMVRFLIQEASADGQNEKSASTAG